MGRFLAVVVDEPVSNRQSGNTSSNAMLKELAIALTTLSFDLLKH
jgi:hypothetical protein